MWFHMNGCGHCERMRDEWAAVQQSLVGMAETVAYEAYANSEIMNAYDIKGFPTLKLLLPDGEVVDYKGNRTAKDMKQFVETNSGPRFIFFYKNGCPWCDAMHDDWEALKQDPPAGVKLVEYEAHAHRDLLDKYGVRGFPHLVLVKNGEKIPYGGNRSTEDMRQFIERHV